MQFRAIKSINLVRIRAIGDSQVTDFNFYQLVFCIHHLEFLESIEKF
jgi:hypothetical protein